MRAKFQCTEVGETHGGAGYVTLKQTYDHTARDINDSTNPEGSLTFDVTDKTGFFQLGHRYFASFTDEAGSPRENKPAKPAAKAVAGAKPAAAPAFKYENGKWVKK